MEIYVDSQSSGGSGTADKPFSTLAAANKAAKPGDVVIVRGIFHEAVNITTANVTWKAAERHKAILDGRYNESKKGKGISGTLPGGKYDGLISIQAEGVTVEGFTVRNAGGCGITSVASRGKIRSNRIDHCYVSAIKVAPDTLVEGVVVENNICTRAGMQSFDASATGGKDPGGGVIKVGRTRNGVIRGNVCGLSYGEGINLGKGNLGIICENNEVFLVSHKHIYVNRSQDVIVRNNVVWYTPGFKEIDDDGDAPGGIGVGDECGNRAEDSPKSCRNDATWPKSKRVQIYNNLVVGLGMLFFVTNGEGNEKGGGYNTVLEDSVIRHNTFVAGPLTRIGVKIGANTKGNPHRDSFFENNLIDWTHAPKAAVYAAGGDLQGAVMRANLWSVAPPERYQGAGDQYGDPALEKGNAEIAVTNERAPATTFDKSNYALTERSMLAIGKAHGGGDIGAIPYGGETIPEPPTEPPTEPEEPTPEPEPEPAEDWRTHYAAYAEANNAAVEAVMRMVAAWGEDTPSEAKEAAAEQP